MASQRQLRVGEEVRHVLSQTISMNDWPVGELSVPVTVTQVSMSPDLQKALVFVMPLGGVEREETLEFLSEMIPYMRKRLASSMSLRRVPMLRFVIDETFDKAEKMDNLFKAIKPSPIKDD
ncbi:MAG: 30S ribosome-binding factor RbfA [Alphaproteobacteria bacterium]|nr:30S ribosome-binding factor RbfA [Alphaproteobacteria bacterium]